MVDRMKVMVKGGILKVSPKVARSRIGKNGKGD
jgi:hypothetical protein